MSGLFGEVCTDLGKFQNEVGKGQALFELKRRIGIFVMKLISIQRKKKKFTE
jgi:hypothetical protein